MPPTARGGGTPSKGLDTRPGVICAPPPFWLHCGHKPRYYRCVYGVIAQLGERYNGIVEVGGSIPPGSTIVMSTGKTRCVQSFNLQSWCVPSLPDFRTVRSRPCVARQRSQVIAHQSGQPGRSIHCASRRRIVFDQVPHSRICGIVHAKSCAHARTQSFNEPPPNKAYRGSNNPQRHDRHSVENICQQSGIDENGIVPGRGVKKARQASSPEGKRMGQATTSHFKTGISGMNRWSSLAHRRLIRIDGPEGRDFLNGLTTQNMHSSSVVFAALLTPQGRFHSDFFVWNHPQRPDSVLLDCHMDHWASIVDVLTLFHGLHDVIIVPDCTDYAVCAGA